MKRGVEAGDLRQRRIPLAKRFDQFDLRRQMFRRVGADAAQLVEQLGGNAFRLFVAGTAVDYAVAHGCERERG